MGASSDSSRNTRLSFDLIRSRNTQSRARGGRWRGEGGGVIQPVMEEGVGL